jgi:hypothetical protein
MNAYKRYTWLLIGCLLLAVMLGLVFSSPLPAVGQGGGTPTHEPPPVRTLPPGIRATPKPSTAQNTPAPPSENPNIPTPTPAPVILLPVAGDSTGGADQFLNVALIMGGLGLFTLGLLMARRSRTE